jgi:hypothetical protein
MNGLKALPCLKLNKSCKNQLISPTVAIWQRRKRVFDLFDLRRCHASSGQAVPGRVPQSELDSHQMLSTTSYYLTLTKNLAKSQAQTAAEPQVESATAYFEANIGNVKSVSDLLNNSKLYNYVMNAYGLGSMTYAKGLITKVLEGGVSSSTALANTLNDPRYKALATAFNFAANGTATTSNSTTIQNTVSAYVEQQLETNVGKQSPGVQLALYFQRVAPTLTNTYGILADSQLLKVVQTALGLSPDMGEENIDTEASQLAKLVDVSDFQNPAKLQSFLESFTANYDVNNTTTPTPVNALMVSNSSTPGVSSSLLLSLANLKLGGS